MERLFQHAGDIVPDERGHEEKACERVGQQQTDRDEETLAAEDLLDAVHGCTFLGLPAFKPRAPHAVAGATVNALACVSVFRPTAEIHAPRFAGGC